MYSSIYSTLRLFWKGGLEVRRHLAELEKTQWYTQEQLRDWQFARVKALVEYAYEHVPYYRNRYRELGIHPEDILDFGDFERLPFLERQDVIDHLDGMISPEWRGRLTEDSTSGSTGEPLRFYIDRSYHWWDWALELRGRGWYGVKQGDKTAMVWGAQRDIRDQTRRARMKAAITRERYLNAYAMTSERMGDFAGMMAAWRPPLLRGYPSALTLLAEHMRERDLRVVPPRVIETTAEKLTPDQRAVLESVFQAKVADWYTTREFGTITYQCPAGGIHVCETRYLEVLAGGRGALPGELGEIAITSLSQYGMPFIRYKIGDMAVRCGTVCACGRSMPVLDDVAGRRQEILVAPDGRRVYSGFITYTLRKYPDIRRFQVYQPREDRLEVRLVLRQGAAADSRQWIEDLRNRLLNQFGPEMEVLVEVVESILLSKSGKHRPIVSDVAPAPRD